MAASIGTRTVASARHERIDQGGETRNYTRDLGMTKNVTASLTFTTDGKITGANGTFTGTFAVLDPVLIGGTNLNNDFAVVTALDAVNAAFIIIDPPPKAEGPITATVRTV